VEEHVVDDAEDNRGSTDAESQSKDGDEGETTTFAKVAECVAEVAGETIEVGFHTSKLYTEAAANCRDLTTKEKAGGPAFIPSDIWGGLPLRLCLLQGWDILANFKVPVLADTLSSLSIQATYK